MRNAILVLFILGTAQAVRAQSYSISELSPVAGISFYSINRTSMAGPSIAVHYSLNRYQVPILEFSGGVALRFADSKNPLPTRIASTDEIAGVRSPLPNGREYFSAPPPNRTALSFGYGFFGADAKLFLASGSVRPYVSAGVLVLLYTSHAPLTTAVAPDIRAGLDVQFSNGFSAFGEIRHFIGLPGVLSPQNRAFDNATTLALGFTFFPSFD